MPETCYSDGKIRKQFLVENRQLVSIADSKLKQGFVL